MAILGLLLMALGWINATVSDRNPVLLFVGFAFLVAARQWPARHLRVAAGVLSAPLAYWLYTEGVYQGPICYEDGGCVESWWLPPQAFRTALELLPYLVVAALAWRLLRRHPLARGPVIHAREDGL